MKSHRKYIKWLCSYCMYISSDTVISISSLSISIFAAFLSFFKYSKKSKIQRRADLVSIFSAIIALIDSIRAIESRGLLRKNEKLVNLKNIIPNKDDVPLSPSIDEKSEEAARYVATTYDRLGFILKNDVELEESIIGWHSDTIIDIWLLTRHLIKKWIQRNKRYAKEFERLTGRTIKLLEYDKNYNF